MVRIINVFFSGDYKPQFIILEGSANKKGHCWFPRVITKGSIGYYRSVHSFWIHRYWSACLTPHNFYKEFKDKSQEKLICQWFLCQQRTWHNYLQGINRTTHLKRMLFERSTGWGHSQYYFKDNPFVEKMESVAGSVTSTMVNITFILPFLKGWTMKRKTESCKVSVLFGPKKSSWEISHNTECLEHQIAWT